MQDLQRFDQLYPHEAGDIGEFHVKKGIGGLRNFQMTMWLYSFERWIPARQVYDQVRSTRRFDKDGAPTPKVLDAAGVIFTTRCWIEQVRAGQPNPPKNKQSSGLLIDKQDMAAFQRRFGAKGLTELNSARAAIQAYRRETMDHLMEHGVVVPDTDGLIVWGPTTLMSLDSALGNFFHSNC